jgi:hypothetical protein
MALKVITPGSNTGYDTVGTTDYRAGMVAARVATTGLVVPSDGTDTQLPPIGILGEDKLTTAVQQTTQQNEQVTLTSGVAVALAHDAVVANSQFVEVASDGTDLTEATDYTFADAAGTITSQGTQADGTVVYVTYTYQLNDQDEKDFRGVNYKGALDDTEGSGKATVWKGYGEYETDQFDTAIAYAVNDKLEVTNGSHGMGAGFISKSGTSNTGDIIIGRVTKVPTASDPWLGFSFEPSVKD